MRGASLGVVEGPPRNGGVKRGGPLRRTPIKRKGWRPKPKPHRDPVTPEVYEHVRSRDRRATGRDCIGPFVGMPGACEGPIEEDHVRKGGMGWRSRSTPDNLVSLCRLHHRTKTEASKVWRPVLIDYLDRWEGANPTDGPT